MAMKFCEERPIIEDCDKEIIMDEIDRRQRFRYRLKDMIKYVMKCIYCKKNKAMLMNPKLRKHAIFKKGSQKLN